MVVCFHNSELRCEVIEGETLLSVLGRHGVSIAAPCGGRHLCGKCKAKIVSGLFRGDVPDSSGLVLACRAIPETDLTVEIPSLEHTYDGGAYQFISPDGNFPEQVTGSIKRAGVALDIGTTTVSARLVDLDTRRELGTYSALNAQKVFGADVMSRIGAARAGKTQELFSLINRQTREILESFRRKYNVENIELLTVAANTTMLHLFANTDPSMMGEVPFTPVFLEERIYSGEELSLQVDKVLLFPSISAFIGGDIVSGLGEIGILNVQETALFIDIGTNGEMALYHNGKIYCASAAAGPALEGAEISCGAGSIRGAINKVEWADGEIHFTTIGGEKPLGICGCGLIDAMALMLDQEVIDEGGAFSDGERKAFSITRDISLVNRDVRQFQLAKSALLSGIKILCKSADIEPADVRNVYIAGGLGFYIDQKNAVKTGILPGEFLDRIRVCGNTSLKGAVKALLDPSFLDYCKKITGISGTMELASDPAFMDLFAENMLFPF